MTLNLFSEKEETFKKKTGYRTRETLGYTGEKFAKECYQKKLRDSYSREKVKGLDGIIREISFSMAQRFILKYEWLGTMGTTKHSVGYFVDNDLVAVFCFGLTAGTQSLAEPFGVEHKTEGIVLVRGACSPEAHHHTASHSIPKALRYINKQYGYLFCIAYSDPEAGEIGTVYQATNWHFYGMTSPVTYLIRPDGKRVDPKIIHKYAKKNNISSSEQKKAFFAEGYVLEKGNSKLKYLKLIGDKRQSKKLLTNKRVNFYPYLKRYDDMRQVYCKFKESKQEEKDDD